MYTIQIDLNYQDNPENECREMWGYIRDAMEEAGFHLRGRRFFIDASPSEAIEWSKEAIDNLESQKEVAGKRAYHFIKEFFGYRIEDVFNVLTPADSGIEVEEVDRDDMDQYFAS